MQNNVKKLTKQLDKASLALQRSLDKAPNRTRRELKSLEDRSFQLDELAEALGGPMEEGFDLAERALDDLRKVKGDKKLQAFVRRAQEALNVAQYIVHTLEHETGDAQETAVERMEDSEEGHYGPGAFDR